MGFVSWQHYCTASSSGRQPNCGVGQRVPPVFGRVTITLGIGSHSSFILFLLFLFLAESQWSEIGCLPYFHTWYGLSVNLECSSEMCCTWLAENTGRKNDAKNRHLGTTARFLAEPSQVRDVSTIGRK